MQELKKPKFESKLDTTFLVFDLNMFHYTRFLMKTSNKNEDV